MRKSLLALAVMLLFSACAKPMPLEEAGEKIRKMLVLPAYEHIYRDIIYFNEQRSLLFFRLYKKELLFSVNIRIQAGVDLQKGFSVVNDGTDSIRITLPPAEILLADADENSIHEMFLTEDNKQIKLLDYYSEIEARKQEIVDDAMARGILAKAEENIRFMLNNMCTGAGYERVTVQFGNGGPDRAP
ncbi:MAG: DUF4230 domain-containing protein [Spirochaetales bacterium]|nr:DUF4230 domain-containing protein [Spirochaetales bacterium]